MLYCTDRRELEKRGTVLVVHCPALLVFHLKEHERISSKQKVANLDENDNLQF